MLLEVLNRQFGVSLFGKFQPRAQWKQAAVIGILINTVLDFRFMQVGDSELLLKLRDRVRSARLREFVCIEVLLNRAVHVPGIRVEFAEREILLSYIERCLSRQSGGVRGSKQIFHALGGIGERLLARLAYFAEILAPALRPRRTKQSRLCLADSRDVGGVFNGAHARKRREPVA